VGLKFCINMIEITSKKKPVWLVTRRAGGSSYSLVQ
jgi:hypothetical protein